MNRLKPGLSYTLCSVSGKNPGRLFTMSTVVDGKRVTGSGTSILRAKRATAEKALALLNKSRTSDPSSDTRQPSADNKGNYTELFENIFPMRQTCLRGFRQSEFQTSATETC